MRFSNPPGDPDVEDIRSECRSSDQRLAEIALDTMRKASTLAMRSSRSSTTSRSRSRGSSRLSTNGSRGSNARSGLPLAARSRGVLPAVDLERPGEDPDGDRSAWCCRRVHRPSYHAAELPRLSEDSLSFIGTDSRLRVRLDGTRLGGRVGQSPGYVTCCLQTA
jgi:hypothetical protein